MDMSDGKKARKFGRRGIQQMQDGVEPYLVPAQNEPLLELRYIYAGWRVIQDLAGTLGSLGVKTKREDRKMLSYCTLVVAMSVLQSSEAKIPSICMLGYGITQLIRRRWLSSRRGLMW